MLSIGSYEDILVDSRIFVDFFVEFPLYFDQIISKHLIYFPFFFLSYFLKKNVISRSLRIFKGYFINYLDKKSKINMNSLHKGRQKYELLGSRIRHRWDLLQLAFLYYFDDFQSILVIPADLQ